MPRPSQCYCSVPVDVLFVVDSADQSSCLVPKGAHPSGSLDNAHPRRGCDCVRSLRRVRRPRKWKRDAMCTPSPLTPPCRLVDDDVAYGLTCRPAPSLRDERLPGQRVSTRRIASRSGGVTHRPYFDFTAT